MSNSAIAAQRLAAARPRDRVQLHRFVRRAFNLRVPWRAGGEGDAPFDYLSAAFFEEQSPHDDLLVWANRGGGKTLLGAVATMLDLLFKPGVQVRILGGSLEQSARMHAHLRDLAQTPLVRPLLGRSLTQRRIELCNGSVAEILAQSQRAVRGLRVHKLRCDELEEFDPGVWQAAQLVTHSSWCGPVHVRGRVEALSTMHRPFGLMSRLINEREEGAPRPRRVFRWNCLDVIERCRPERDCQRCPLWADCQGRAKEANGFVRVDDLVQQWHRTSSHTWGAEMLCKQPRRDDCVYPNFEPAVHVGERSWGEGPGALIAGLDFGLRSPLAMVWAEHHYLEGGQSHVHVVGEYEQTGLTLSQHLDRLGRHEASPFGELDWIGVDPAGGARNSQTGLSDIAVLRQRGLSVRWTRSRLREGIELIRRRLDRGTLTIDPRCVRLIHALQAYHFDTARPETEEPVKDGPDHLADALRYMLINLERHGSPAAVACYL